MVNKALTGAKGSAKLALLGSGRLAPGEYRDGSKRSIPR